MTLRVSIILGAGPSQVTYSHPIIASSIFRDLISYERFTKQLEQDIAPIIWHLGPNFEMCALYDFLHSLSQINFFFRNHNCSSNPGLRYRLLPFYQKEKSDSSFAKTFSQPFENTPKHLFFAITFSDGNISLCNNNLSRWKMERNSDVQLFPSLSTSELHNSDQCQSYILKASLMTPTIPQKN